MRVDTQPSLNYQNRIVSKAKQLLSTIKIQTEKFLYSPNVIEKSLTPELKAKFLSISPTTEKRIKTFSREQDQLCLFISEIKPDDVVWDIGACHGMYTIYSALQAIDGQVVSIEPDSENIRLIQNNIKINNLQNVTILPIALWDHDTDALKLDTSGASGKSPRLAEVVRQRSQDAGKFKNRRPITSRSADSLIKSGIKPPNIIKMDIEGAELNALIGMKELLSGELGTKPRLISLEIHHALLPENQTSEMIFALMSSFGYNCSTPEKRDTETLVFFSLGSNPS